MSVWQLYFGWPDGQVWPNLVASAVTSAGAVAAIGWRLLCKIRAEHDQHHALLRREHIEHRELLQQQMNLHHEQIRKTIQATMPQGGIRVKVGGEDGTQQDTGS